MPGSFFSTTAITLLALIAAPFFIMRILRSFQATKQTDHSTTSISPGLAELVNNLHSALPSSIILPEDVAMFRESMNVYWAQQECELCIAVTILKRAFDDPELQLTEGKRNGVFAVRGGGRSPVSGAASIEGGVIIDLGLFCEVTPSDDGKSVLIGAGCKWMDVSKVLDKKGLAVAGGRNSAVGVGGLTLGGGISFFTPRFGLVCSNVISYEVVLASGSVITASESSNPDLWRALKGGANNFGIVTRFTIKSFTCANIWSGFIYTPSFQAPKVLTAFYQSVEAYGSHSDPDVNNTAGPIACFSYIHQLGIQAISVNLVHTSPPLNSQKWPVYWKNSPFSSLWRLWSTCKIRSLSSATDEMNALNPAGRRQIFVTTTIKNDLNTLTATHATYRNAISALRRQNVKGLVWTLFIQPLLPSWARTPNPLGLDKTQDNLIIVTFTINWNKQKDDVFMKKMARRTIEEIDAFATANNTGHQYRYLNYFADWQRPFDGYGVENKVFLEEVSRKYDTDGLFQTGCTGGFKLIVGVQYGGS